MKPIWKAEAAERLDAALEAAQKRTTDVARALRAAGIKADPSMVSRWRSGERIPDADQLAAMLKLCGGSADAVLGLSGHVGAENAQLRAALRQVEAAATMVLGARGVPADRRGRGR
jgi:transcriptional regulator with XRE-family HTH domain